MSASSTGAPQARPPSATGPQPKSRGNLAAVIGVGLLVALGVIWYVFFRPGGGVPTINTPASVDLPPVGQIWFGNSFDTTTFAVRGRTSSVTSGTTVALVAQLPRSISSGDANMRITVDGQTISNSQLTMQGSGELFGVTYPLSVPGTYVFTITDIGGNALASGSITAAP